MAGSLFTPIHPCHIRSISLSSRSHSIVLIVEQEMQKLRNYIASTSSTPETFQVALRGLADLYDSLEDLFQLPSKICSSEKSWLEKELDESIKLLDLCSAMKDSVATKKEHIKDFELVLRRRDGAAIRNKVTANILHAKKADKDIKNCLSSLKHLPKITIDMNSRFHAMAEILTDVKNITISLLQIVCCSLSTQTAGRQSSSRWSFIANTLSKRKVKDARAHEEIDSSLFFQSFPHIDFDDERLEKVYAQLQSLEDNFSSFEIGLQSLFRKLIHIRVTLLNLT